MKRLLTSLAALAVGAMLAMPAAVSAATYDEGGLRWKYGVYQDEDTGAWHANINVVVQIDGSGKEKATWNAATLTVPATLPVPGETNEFTRAEYDASGNPISYTTVRGPTVKSGVAKVTYFNAELNGTTALTSVTIPDTVEYVTGFRNCANLATVTMGAETEFSHWSFSGTPWLKAQGELVVRGDMLVAYQGSATEVTVPDGVKRIGDDAFDRDCNDATRNLTSVTLPAGLEEIGGDAFWGCEKMAAIEIPDSVKFIDYGAFCGCAELASARLPSKVKRLNEGVFAGCAKLADVTLPANLKSIGEYAFEACKSLAAVTMPASVEWIGDDAFSYCTSPSPIPVRMRFFSTRATRIRSARNRSSRTSSIPLPTTLRRRGRMPRRFAPAEAAQERGPRTAGFVSSASRTDSCRAPAYGCQCCEVRRTPCGWGRGRSPCASPPIWRTSVMARNRSPGAGRPPTPRRSSSPRTPKQRPYTRHRCRTAGCSSFP